MLEISLLEKQPELDAKVKLEILPLAPLSMVADLPGSYYKSLKEPNKIMLTGLFENILGWHIDLADRMAILKDLKKLRKKQGIDFEFSDGGSTFLPLLGEYFSIDFKILPPYFAYDDYWNRAYRREPSPSDTMPVHANGTIFLDHAALIEKHKLARAKNLEKLDNTALGKFAGENKDKYPLYYSTPTRREYIVVDGVYSYEMQMDNNLAEMLIQFIGQNNAVYLGNNESWVDVRMERI